MVVMLDLDQLHLAEDLVELVEPVVEEPEQAEVQTLEVLLELQTQVAVVELQDMDQVIIVVLQEGLV